MVCSLTKRFIIIVIVMFTVAQQAMLANELGVPENSNVSPLLRSTHFVNDIDSSLELYRDILGLDIWLDRIFDDVRFNTVLGTKGKQIRAVVLRSGETVNGGVGLFQYIGHGKKQEPHSRTYVEQGDAILVFITSDIFGIYNKVKDAGYSIASEPTILFPKSDQEPQDYEMLFFDNDGIGVNLIQRSLEIK